MSDQLSKATLQTRSAISQRQAAVMAGLAYAVLSVLALFANFFVLGGLTAPDDPATTVRNISDSEVLYRSGVAAFIIVLILDVVVAWALYVFLQPTDRDLSLFAAWFRLIYVAITAAALLALLVAVKLVDDNGYSTAIEAGQRNAQVMLSLDAYRYGWRIALAFFGVNLLLLGHLMARSTYVPRLLAILVGLAGFGYLASMLAIVLAPNSSGYEDLAVLPLGVLALPGELGLTGWLLWRGGKHT